MLKLSYRDICAVTLGFFVCVIIFSIRNLEPLLFPTLYAEDGVWLGLIMQNGFWDTALHAREGFPVLGLVGLDWMALKLDLIFSKGQIFDLPFYVWAVSIGFLSAVSVFPLIAFRSIISLRYRLSLLLILPLMPVGASGNEIYGRINNLGFLFPLICVYSICFLRTSLGNTAVFIICLIVVAISAMTFPVCLGILMLWLMAEISLMLSKKYNLDVYKYFVGIETYNLGRILLLAFVFFACIYFMPSNLFSYEGGAQLPTKTAGWIDYVGGRLALYPLVSSFYSSMTNLATVLFCIFIILFLLWGVVAKNHGKVRFANLFLLASFVLYLAATAIMRSGFTSLFGEYTNSFPDRYFMGINVLFLVVLLSNVYQLPRFRNIGFLSIFALFFINVAVLHNRVFEGASPVMNWREFGDLRHMTCSIASKSAPPESSERENLVVTYKGGLAEFPIYPKVENLDWRMTVPKAIFSSSIKAGCFGYPEH